MKVSVIIPTHNRIEKLYRAYQSVCKQTRKPEEIIIIDDGSQPPVNLEDKNLFCAGIKTLINRNEYSLGACQARNLGAETATGDVLMFLDDDDTWEAEKIAAQMSVFTSHPSVGLVYSGRLVVQETKRDRILYKILPKAVGNIYPQIMYSNLIGTTSSVAILKSLFDQIEGFDPEMPALQDHDLWIRASKKTLVAHDNSCNVRYTISPKPSTQISGRSGSYVTAVNKIIEKYNSEITNQGWLGSRKIRSSFYFFAAKSCRLQGVIPAIPWITKSLKEYPNFKAIMVIFPAQIIQLLQRLIARYYETTKSYQY